MSLPPLETVDGGELAAGEVLQGLLGRRADVQVRHAVTVGRREHELIIAEMSGTLGSVSGIAPGETFGDDTGFAINLWTDEQRKNLAIVNVPRIHRVQSSSGWVEMGGFELAWTLVVLESEDLVAMVNAYGPAVRRLPWGG